MVCNLSVNAPEPETCLLGKNFRDICMNYQKIFVSTIKKCLYQLSKDICINYQKIFVSTIKRYLYPLSKDICINHQHIYKEFLAKRDHIHISQMGKHFVSDGHFCKSFCPASQKLRVSGDFRHCCRVMIYLDCVISKID